MIVRNARLEDLAAVENLAAKFGTSFPFDVESFRHTYPRLIDKESAHLLLAEIDSTVVGYLLAFRHETFFANGTVLSVEELMVAETHRRLGVGRALMAAIETLGRDSDCKMISLATRRAADFYLSIGYTASAQYFHKRL